MVPEEARSVIKCIPFLEELDIEPTEKEVKEAPVSPDSGKAPCQDGFPAEIQKCMQHRRCLHQALRNPLSVLASGLGKVRHESRRFRDWEDWRDCFNNRGITLFSIAEKLSVQVQS